MSDQILTRPSNPLADTATMVSRGVRLIVRDFEEMLTSVMLPVMLLLAFVFLFGGAIKTGGVSYVDFVVPGILILCTGFVSASTAISVSMDMTEGIIDRFRSMDISGAAVLGGHVAASLVRTASATVVTVFAALLVGFRPSAGPLEWLVVIGVLVAFTLAVSWLAAAFGLIAKTPQGAGALQFFILFLPYASSGFVPIDTMPGWLGVFAENQPFTPVIESIRGLLLGGPVSASVAVALAWCAGILLVSAVLSAILFRRRTS